MKVFLRLLTLAGVGFWMVLTSPGAAETAAEANAQQLIAPEAGTSAEFNPAAPKLSRSDKRFIKKYTASSGHSIAISKQAVTRAVHADVRAYAETVVNTEELITGELVVLARRRGGEAAIGHTRSVAVEKLTKKSIDAYDEAYLKEVMGAHKTAIALLEKAVTSSDTYVAAFAVQYLAVMRDHLARARQIEKMLN
ncbi:DUF4142 domain-containing protein [Rariglobus hedericola]|nr:DUF4142 domain-containing protein [Rariglobus hedericola]